mmetsp:Transcript_118458/g.334959  ORF Transcript_118458/g.334959 Transcript_118458/m.334959 type:complete len:362 (+) Transcript_118458:105-1190(+)
MRRMAPPKALKPHCNGPVNYSGVAAKISRTSCQLLHVTAAANGAISGTPAPAEAACTSGWASFATAARSSASPAGGGEVLVEPSKTAVLASDSVSPTFVASAKGADANGETAGLSHSGVVRSASAALKNGLIAVAAAAMASARVSAFVAVSAPSGGAPAPISDMSAPRTLARLWLVQLCTPKPCPSCIRTVRAWTIASCLWVVNAENNKLQNRCASFQYRAQDQRRPFSTSGCSAAVGCEDAASSAVVLGSCVGASAPSVAPSDISPAPSSSRSGGFPSAVAGGTVPASGASGAAFSGSTGEGATAGFRATGGNQAPSRACNAVIPNAWKSNLCWYSWQSEGYFASSVGPATNWYQPAGGQ